MVHLQLPADNPIIVATVAGTIVGFAAIIQHNDWTYCWSCSSTSNIVAKASVRHSCSTSSLQPEPMGARRVASMSKQTTLRRITSTPAWALLRPLPVISFCS
jgi:hypothetical protein